MLSPNSPFHNYWNILVVLSASFIALFIPLDILFNLKSIESFVVLDSAVTIIFIIDIFYNIYKFKTIKTKHIFEEEFGLPRYFKRWFIFDLLAAIPIGLIIHPSLWQLLRLLKLVKVAHFMHLWRQRQVKFANLLALGFFIFWIAHSAHWISCGWLALRGLESSISDASNYLKSLYWCIQTLTTVGYGDITPQNNQQIIYTIVVQIMGVGVYGYVIGNIASILSKRDPAKTQYLENLEKLTALNHYRKLPLDLQKKIGDFYAYMYKQKLGYDESAILEGLPPGLKTEVSLHLKKEVIEKIPLFKDADPEFIREVAMYLKSVVLTPGDCIFKAGDIGKDMYFVVRGELVVLSPKEDNLLATLSAGDFFGEIALFMNKPRTATIKAVDYCDLYSLSKATFDYAVSKYPEIAAQIEQKAKTRENQIVN